MCSHLITSPTGLNQHQHLSLHVYSASFFVFFFPKSSEMTSSHVAGDSLSALTWCSTIEQEHRHSKFGSLFSENCWKAAIYPWPGISDQRLPALETLNCWYCWQKSYSHFLVRLCHINWRLFSLCQRTMTSSPTFGGGKILTPLNTEPMLIVGLTPCFS